MERQKNPIDVFSGLIKIIWHEQLSLWEKHLSQIHSKTRQTQESSYDKFAMYKARVRQLHLQRAQCLPGHREIYFHPDVESFLSIATGTQLKQYLHHYEPAIQASISDARQNQLRTIFTFPGFTRSATTGPRLLPIGMPQRHPPLPTLMTAQQETPSHSNRGTKINRKHTRWRPLTNPLRSIRSFFITEPD